MKTRRSHQRGWVEKRARKNGETIFMIRWYVRDHTAPKGWKKRSKLLSDCKSKKAARIELDREIRQVNQVCSHNGFSDSRTLGDFIKGTWTEYLKNRRQVKPSTLYVYNSMLKNYVLPEFERMKLHEIRPEHLTRFFERLLSRVSAKYVGNVYSMLKTVFDLAGEYDLIDVSPLRRKLHRPSHKQREKGILSEKQIQAVLKQIANEWKPLFVCVVLTGLRVGELLGLRWCDVNFLSRRLSIRHSLWRGQLLEPKTDASRRTLHLPEPLLKVLLTHKQQSRFTQPDDFVFCKADGSPCDPDHLRNEVLYPAMDRAGIQRLSRSHGFHVFRHTAGSIVHRETGSIKLAQRQLGHSQMSTTADIYIHLDSEETKRAAEALARAISCPPYCPLGDSESGIIH